MARHHSGAAAAAVAFRSDIARALARRAADMPLHSQVRPQAKADASVPDKKNRRGKAK
jgi:hypothetical protein